MQILRRARRSSSPIAPAQSNATGDSTGAGANAKGGGVTGGNASKRLNPPSPELSPSALTIGNFDGIHRGHRALMKHVAETARERGLVPTVVTLCPHPREMFDPAYKLRRISTLRDQVMAMKSCGIERVCILPFNRQLANQEPLDFVQNTLINYLHARQIWVGDDFRFGSHRAGDFEFLQKVAPDLGFDVNHIHEIQSKGHRVSSSHIRDALAQGNIAEATELLGHPLVYSGHVTHGKKLGRTLGFPTLNLAFKARASSLDGVLAVWVHGLGPQPLAAVASLGTRPTVEQSDRILLETFIPNWEGNAYGKLIAIEVMAHIRPEARFSGLNQMTKQMHTDTKQALTLLENSPARYKP